MNTPPIENIAPLTGRIIREDGSVANVAEAISRRVEAMTNINWVFREVIRENVFAANHVFLNVADQSTAYLRIRETNGGHLFVFVNASMLGKARIMIWSGTTFSAEGTIVPVWNRHVGGRIPTAEVLHTPTINVLGTKRLDQLFPSGANPTNRVAGTSEDSFGSVIPPGGEILVGLQNLSTVAADIGMSFTFVEKNLSE